MSTTDMRIGIIVVAYNAESTLVRTLERIPPSCRTLLSEIIISDDASSDSTSELGVDWAWRNPEIVTHVIRQTKNQGYGGNQKAAYSLAIEHGLDAVVLLHADGQYAPESMPDLLAPILRGEADAVFGSRMATPGAARAGGMPIYKWIGNRILTTLENRALGMDLSEFHSGYRAYTTQALKRIPFQHNSDVFDFDSQIIIQLMDIGAVIQEVPIPTFYGDEICYVNGMKYAKDVLKDLGMYRLANLGIGNPRWVPTSAHDCSPAPYESPAKSHTLDYLAQMPPSRILDLGCGEGVLAEYLRPLGHFVVGVDKTERVGVRKRTDRFYKANLDSGIPQSAGRNFDVVVAHNILEHLQYPEGLLDSIRSVLTPGGILFLSTPNIGHWYARARIALGAWDYDRKGVLHVDHLRFFSRRSIRRLCLASGFDISHEHTSPLSDERAGRPGSRGFVSRIAGLLCRLRPELFGHQVTLRLTPHAGEVRILTCDGWDAISLPLHQGDRSRNRAGRQHVAAPNAFRRPDADTSYSA